MDGNVILMMSNSFPGHTVFTAPFTEYWRSIRKAINATVGKAHVGQFNDLFDTQSRKLVSLLAAKVDESSANEINPRSVVEYIALTTALSITAGKTYNAEDLDLVRIVEDLEEMERLQSAKYTRLTAFFPWLKAALGFKNLILRDKDLNTLRSKMLNPFYDMLVEVEETTQEKKPLVSSICANLLAIDIVPGAVVDGKTTGPVPFKKEQALVNITHITHHAYTYISSALNTLIQRLATEEQVQEQAYNEIVAMLAGKPVFESKTKDLLGKMPYLGAIIKESLRMNPPQTLFAHAARADESFAYKDQIYRIDNRNEIVANLDAIHYDVKRYTTKDGHGPEEFYPARFLPPHAPKGFSTLSSYDLYTLNSGGDKARDLPRDHLAFGAGRRICLGAEVTERTLLSTMVELLYHYKLSGGDVHTKKHHLTSVYGWTGRTELIGGDIKFTPRH
jgi:Cytochrome P450